MFVSRQHRRRQLLTGLKEWEAGQWYDNYAPRVTSIPIMGLRVLGMIHEVVSQELMKRW
jgi:hypothetical protein